MNISFVPHNTKTISIAYKSKFNDYWWQKWHYLAVRSLSALLRGITSNNNGDFYCLNCFHSHRTHNKLKKHERVCNNHDYCYVEIPKEDEKILKYNHGEKLLKAPIIIIFNLIILEK